MRYLHFVFLIGILFLADCFLSSHAQGCASGWFGSPKCMYKCHCTPKRSCEDDGDCETRSKCDTGWFGPACQYEVLTYSTSTPGWLRDGNANTCNSPGSLSVTADILEVFSFTWLRLYVNDTGVLKNFTVQFKNRTENSNTLDCRNMRTASVDNKTLDIHCDVAVTVQQVILTGEGVRALCSLYISGGRNVALKQNTTQSSFGGPTTVPENAVDGNTDGRVIEGKSCTHTLRNDSKPTWSVMFPQRQHVSRYVLYNRKDCCPERLRRFTLTSFSENSEVLRYQDPTDNTNHDTYTILSAPSTPPISSVTIAANYTYDGGIITLTLCEVEIYGETVCPRGTFGLGCNGTCNCAVPTEACFVSTGGCPSGCAAGFYGENCHLPCPPTKYGVDCKEACSAYCKESLCDGKNGDCDSCIAGKQGIKCEEDCEFGRFGENCKQQCSKNCGGDGSCHSQNGNCILGCRNGYLGHICNESCAAGKYGKRCLQNCSKNCNEITDPGFSSRCYHENGYCLQGCQEGYQEPLCVDLADETSVPLGAIIGAVVAVVAIAALIVGGVLLWRRRRQDKKGTAPFAGNPASEGSPGSDATFTDPVFKESEQGKSATLPRTGAKTGQAELLAVAEEASANKSKIKPMPPQKSKSESNICEKDYDESEKSKPRGYYNTLQESGLKTVAVGNLHTFMISHDKAFFQQEFNSIPANKNATTVICLSDKNKAKNRYRNICAYDHSRVHLKICNEKNQGDYINASYIEGYKLQEKFIASQGPTKLILEDFIRMLWEQQVEKVVMLTNLVEEGKQKCERYWPEDGEIQIGDIKVSLTITEVFADYTIRRLQLSKKGEPVRHLAQFHFTSWPDKGVPTLAWGLVDFEQRVASYPTDWPIVVHCSAGVGRTGTFIALRNVMREAEDTGHINFFTTVQKLREDRINMVQTAEQYEFLHKAAHVAIVCMGTTVTASDIQQRLGKLDRTSVSGQSNMEKEFKAICNVCDNADDNMTTKKAAGENTDNLYENSRSVGNNLKNRLSNILPKEYYRPKLTRESNDVDDYINAVFVPSFRKLGQQILTQLPLPTTVTDFWRLVAQYRVSLVVAFELDLKNTDSTIVDYLPSTENEPLAVSNYNINAVAATRGELWEAHKVTITTNKEMKEQKPFPNSLKGELQMTHFKSMTTDLDPDKLLTLVNEIRSHSTLGQGRILYMCRNGADYCGLVCVLSLLLDRLDNDQRLTVPLVVGTIKSIRPQVIPTLEQYNLLYEVLKVYIENSSIYNNVSSGSA